MSSNAFRVDEREFQFALFEHINIEQLFAFDYFKDHSRETIEQTLAVAMDLCREQLGPLNRSADKEGCRFNKETNQVFTPKGTREIYKTYCENGFVSVTAPGEEGGIQAPATLGVALSELFSGCNCAFTMYPGLTRSAAHLLVTHGEAWMKEVVVPRLYSGEWTGTMCLTEPSVGTAVGDLAAQAFRNGDTYLIRGTKQWVSGGEHDLTDNIIHLVLARIEGASPGMKGVSLFMVPRKRIDPHTGAILGDNDMKCVGIEEKMGLHGNSTCLLQFGDSDQCEAYLIGEENQGITYMFLMMNEARIGVGIQGLGMASVAFLNAEEYAHSRVQGTDVETFRDPNSPRVAIVRHPDVRRMLLRQRAIVEGGRALCLSAGFFYDMASHHSDPSERERYMGYVELLTPIVKAWTTDMAYESAVLSVQTYGGYGYTRDYPVEQILRDLKVTSIYEGTNGIQAMDLVGRKMRMKGGMVFMSFIGYLNDFIEANRANGEIGAEVEALETAKNSLAETSMYIAAMGMQGDQKGAVLNAYPFLRAFGHITVGCLLLQQAGVALAALAKGPSASDARFYRNKVRTAKFFINNILPEAEGQLNLVRKADRSCLEFEFEGEVTSQA